MKEIERRSAQNPDTAPHSSPLRTFLLLTLAFTAVFYALIIIPGKLLGGGGRYTTGMMWCPGLAALLACRIHGIPVQALGWRWPGSRFQVASYLRRVLTLWQGPF
jgi:hypothetical protein